jgi:hypothetical protein
MIYCNRINKPKVTIPSEIETLLFKITVANVDPKAMVTIKSKAFIFDNVRFPDTLNKIIIEG